MRATALEINFRWTWTFVSRKNKTLYKRKLFIPIVCNKRKLLIQIVYNSDQFYYTVSFHFY